MNGRGRRGALALVLAGAATMCPAGAAERIAFTEPEIRRILQHGPWPQPVLRDPSNRVSGNPDAVALGRRLFFDRRLSGDGAMSCAACHAPERAFTDARPRAYGRAALDRNTPSVLNVGLARWFGWDGAADSLWLQSIKPILNPVELAADAAHVAKLIREDASLACTYGRSFDAGRLAQANAEPVLVDASKAIAAFLETLDSGRTPFDEFRDALARGDRAAAARYPVAAQRGLRIFVGRGNCSFCHFGPAFTNGEFADVGIPYFVAPGRVDPGRHGGIQQLLADRFNLLGSHSDDASGAAASKTRHVALQHRNYGEFKVPGLRNVGRTAPYMHNGRLATLRDVVRHYSELDEERLHADGERILRPLKLTGQETEDLVAFLESLSDRSPAAPRPERPTDCPPVQPGN
jgi:cytochrome c peroxidase